MGYLRLVGEVYGCPDCDVLPFWQFRIFRRIEYVLFCFLS